MSDRKTPEGEQTLEQQFVDKYFKSLTNLEQIWLSGDTFDEAKFNKQMLFLIRLIPDKKKQIEIIKEWDKGTQRYKDLGFLKDTEVRFFSGLEIVTELILFIGKAFEIINEDITAPATTKEYRRAELDVPEQDDGWEPEEAPASV